MARTTMTQENQGRCETDNSGKQVTAAKKKYRRPAFRHEKVFETLALACGKISATAGQCQAQQKAS